MNLSARKTVLSFCLAFCFIVPVARSFFVALVPEFSVADGDYPLDPLAKGDCLPIDPVWSGHSVGFSLLTLRDVQVAAYYNQYRQLVLAARNLDATQWTLLAVRPYSTVGWDSHNSLHLAADTNGYLHLSGNMHRAPMNYWRSALPLTNSTQLLATNFMVKLSYLASTNNELQSTYPSFFTGPKEEFIFSYRNHTSSTAGSWYLLKYNTAGQTFSQVPLFSWTGNYSVYPAFTVSGGYVHALYVWRATTDASSNYRLSYTRSSDLVNWTDAFGRAVTLPVTPSTSLTTIDDVPVLGGLLNGQPRLSFDHEGLPLILYHKYDEAGHSQVYVARSHTNSTWKIVQLTGNPDWKWEFSGGGSLPPGGSVGNSFYADDPRDGLAMISVAMKRLDGTPVTNTGPYMIDESTLNTVLVNTKTNYYSANTPAGAGGNVDSSALENTYVAPNGDAMIVKRSSSGGLPFAGLHYYLRWEALPTFRDQPRYESNGVTEISPPPSALKLYRTQAEFCTPLMDTQPSFYGRMFRPSTAVLEGAMTLTGDSKRLFGAYLSSPVTGSTNYAEWTFTVPYDRVYAVGGSTCSLTGNDNSFYIKMDDGPLMDWHFTGRWNYKPVTVNPYMGMTSFHLSAGTHTLRVCAREAGAKLEYLWLNAVKWTKTASLTPLSVQGFTLTTNSTAASGYSLSSPEGSDPSGSIAHYEIPVFSTGNYFLLGRTQAQDENSDSFYLSINGGAPVQWDIPQSAPAWMWAPATGGESLSLTNGTMLRLDVTGREGGAGLDSFMLLYNP